MNICGILGRGFGLYGYLPALVQLNNYDIHVPEEYREFLTSRADLSIYDKYINWSDEDEIIRNSDLLIHARRPDDNLLLTRKLIDLQLKPTLILEKPIASNPYSSIILLNDAINAGIIVHSGFIFKFTDWYSEFKRFIAEHSNNLKIKIEWNFKANHFNNNLATWKRDHQFGGGVLRFYSIHLIDLLHDFSFTNILRSNILSNDSYPYSVWQSEFSNDRNQKIELIVDSCNSNCSFNIFDFSSHKKILQRSGPFDIGSSKLQNLSIDPRVMYLHRFIKNTTNSYDKSRLIELSKFWGQIESKTSLI
jgi:hypothetical protein